MRAWHPIEHKVYRGLRTLDGLPSATLVVAVSGGRDSMAALAILQRLALVFKWRIIVAHFHHGKTDDPSQLEFRGQARKVVALAARQFQFVTNRPKKVPSHLSEEQMRKDRYKFLHRVQKACGGLLVTAHHEQDLLETRLINLIRGSGSLGLSSLPLFQASRRLLRPLIYISSQEIGAYAAQTHLAFVKDPSNQSCEYFRNWIRHSWLPSLDSRRPGAILSLARSLEILSREQACTEKFIKQGQLNRRALKGADWTVKSQAVIAFFRYHRIRSYTKAHVEEFLKRLDSRQKNITFTMLNMDWSADAERVSLSQI